MKMSLLGFFFSNKIIKKKNVLGFAIKSLILPKTLKNIIGFSTQ
jgi:hypothetical protein